MVWVTWLVVMIGCHAVRPVHSLQDCRSAHSHWLQLLRPTYHSSNATMSVDVAGLAVALKEAGCPMWSRGWLQLWRVTNHSRNHRPKKFASAEYFSSFERCHKLELDFFAHHATIKLSGTATQLLAQRWDGELCSEAIFNHVVEHEYILRLCRCGNQQPDACDCDSADTLCSDLIEVKPAQNSTVFPWCKVSGPMGDFTFGAQVDAPVVECGAVQLSGTLASCTPLQDYDAVTVSLHQVSPDSSPEHFECDQLYHLGHSSPVLVSGLLQRLNESHGSFAVKLPHLADSAVYCLHLELSNHPYCNAHQVIINHDAGTAPSVCSSFVRHPIVLPKCLPASQSSVVVEARRLPHWADILLCLNAALALMLCTSVVVFVLRRKRSAALQGSSVPLQQQADSTMSQDQDKLLCNGPTRGPVFLLLSPQSHHVASLHACLKEWMECLGCRVHDMYDTDEDEIINPDPHGWVTNILNDPHVKVVVLESLHDAVPGRSHPGKVPPLQQPCRHQESLCLLLDDHRLELRQFASIYLQNHFMGCYNKLLCVQFCPANMRSDQRKTAPASGCLSPLVPQRQILSIPHNFPEIRMWLRPDMTFSAKINDPTDPLNVLEKRLCDTINQSRYDHM